MSANLIRQAKQNPRDEGRPPRDFCRVPRQINFASPPRIEVKILPTSRRHVLARASVVLAAGRESVPLGDFLVFEQDGKVVVAGPRAVHLNYRLGKRVEQEVLASFAEWRGGDE